jgi:hypothetical protein
MIFLRYDLLAAELRIIAGKVWGWSNPWQVLASFAGIDKNRERDRDEWDRKYVSL